MQTGLKDLYEIMNGIESEKESAAQNAAKKKSDMTKSDALCNASLGNLTNADPKLISEAKNKIKIKSNGLLSSTGALDLRLGSS